jgi:GAF domain-containing protein
MLEDGTALQPLVVAGGMDAETEAWLKALRFPIGDGINGNAALIGAPYWTADYLVDDRIPLEPGDIAVAERLGLRGMAAVPLRTPGRGIIGTLAVSYRQPHDFNDEDLQLLQGLADHAAIALTNTGLLNRLEESERRYRHLVDNSPDLIWAIDAEARFTFLSDTCERLTGWRPDELLGRHLDAAVLVARRGDVRKLTFRGGRLATVVGSPTHDIVVQSAVQGDRTAMRRRNTAAARARAAGATHGNLGELTVPGGPLGDAPPAG